jgi:hypothetical protein
MIPAIFLFLLFAPRAQAAALPHIGYIYPAGGQQSLTFKAEIGGQYLDKVYAVYVTGNGVKAKILEHILPETPERIVAAREKGGQSKLKTDGPTSIGKTESAVKTTLKRKIKSFKQQPNVQLEETVVIQLTVSPEATPGRREIRLLTSAGASNPVVFYVGSLLEYREKEPNDREPNAKALPTLPSVINGQIMPGDLDRFRIKAKKGQSLVLETKARALVPYLADTVPGWFQPVITLFDANGKEVGYADDYEFNPDPILFYDVPKDGEYVLEIRDALYRGREDFTYRLTVGELPFIAGRFPLGGPAGSQVFITVSGKNLPAAGLTVDTGHNVPDTYFDLKNKEGLVSNPIRFAVDTLPEMLESEPNNNSQQAQPITLPVIINGRVQTPGDRDVFSFTAKAGREIAAEVIARRLDSPLDSILQLTDSNGKLLQANDDYEDKNFGLMTHHADSYLTYKIPTDGTYFIRLDDIQNKGGGEYAYRLRLSPKQPDFTLRVVPSGITLAAGSSAVITAYALRKDGFGGAVKLSADKGFTLSPAIIAAQAEKTELTITASTEVPPGIFSPRITGTAVIQGQEYQRQAVPADDMVQAFGYRQLVPAEKLFVLVTTPAAFTISVNLTSGERVKIPKNSTAAIVVNAIRRSNNVQGIKLELKDPPPGITMAETNIGGKTAKSKVILKADKEAVVGLKGALILTGTAWLNKEKYIITAPAIPFEIID